ncbi:MAG: FAD-dependent oxidoreductase [Bryobacterales bacterium]|nr:FAD-dependent oxidoreductase [Bryobacterales bacterium]
MKSHFIVVGAGAFGGWTALHLLRAGQRVTLLDAWGPGHSRSSSGDETRVIRGGYGPNRIYTTLTALALQLWREQEQRSQVKLFQQTGVLWFSSIRNQSWDDAALAALQAEGLPYEELSAQEASRRYPTVNWSDIVSIVFEPEAGYLFARRGCQSVLQTFLAEGGEYRQVHASRSAISSGRLHGVNTSDADRMEADQYVFAPGPWMRDSFPELAYAVTPTRQDVVYFATPAGDARWSDASFPAWIDNSPTRFYGIPGNEWRGFKVAMDVPGPQFDPTFGDRLPSIEALNRYRKFVSHRFPVLSEAPVAEFRVCQYEMTPDGHLLADRHPEASNLLLLGGGSGHSYKFSPALGELAARHLTLGAELPHEFQLARLSREGGVGERK